MPRQSGQTRLIDVAVEAGVSIATASRALSGTPGVSPSVAEQVRRVADELGYVTNMHARSLAGGTTGAIGLVVHEIGDPYFSEIASGVLRYSNNLSAELIGLAASHALTGRKLTLEDSATALAAWWKLLGLGVQAQPAAEKLQNLRQLAAPTLVGELRHPSCCFRNVRQAGPELVMVPAQRLSQRVFHRPHHLGAGPACASAPGTGATHDLHMAEGLNGSHPRVAIVGSDVFRALIEGLALP